MKHNGTRILLFRILTLAFVIIFIETSGYVAMWLNSRSFDWLGNRNYFKIRGMLMGRTEADQFPRYLTLPYLGYIPYPGYMNHGVVQHNDAGYRGHKVPLLKTGKFRVLCLGGSTTYGLGVELPSQAYPAQLEGLLNNYIIHDSFLSQKYSGAEVINAGLESGTSAEELQQYLFKYRYYRPDAVIVHSGVNDAYMMCNTGDFQLDYTHARRLEFHLEPLSAPARWFMRSYFASFIVIRLFYENFYYCGPNGLDFYAPQHSQKFCRWTDINMDTVFKNQQYQYLPFYQNTKSLYTEVIRDSAALIILPNILNTNDSIVKMNKGYRLLSACNKYISDTLAKQIGGTSIYYTVDSVSPDWWIDDCHLNKAGEENKAKISLPYLIKVAYNRANITRF